jgi:Zn-finger nucleic acid-binding protein
MNCPDCGANLETTADPNDLRCPGCATPGLPEESVDGVAVVGEPVGAVCPLCRTPLVSALTAGETICYCGHCGGFLVPIETFSVIVSKRRALHGPHEKHTEPFDPTALQRVLLCPRCQERMDTHPYYGGGNAVVDTCEDCGLIWLDAGELAIIERYVPHVPQIERTLTPLGGRYQGGPFDMPS